MICSFAFCSCSCIQRLLSMVCQIYFLLVSWRVHEIWTDASPRRRWSGPKQQTQGADNCPCCPCHVIGSVTTCFGLLQFCQFTPLTLETHCEQGKLETEALLAERGVTWTSIRPVYIYGPLNYNPVEEWFFHRIKAGRPVPVPGSGMQVTQASRYNNAHQVPWGLGLWRVCSCV